MDLNTVEKTLSMLNVSSQPFSAFRGQRNWSLLPVHERPITMLVVVQGSAKLRISATKEIELHRGVLIVFQCQGAQVLDSGEPSTEQLLLAHAGVQARLPDGSDIDLSGGPLLLDMTGLELLRTVSGDLLNESASGAPGSMSIVDCIVKRLFTVLLRAYPDICRSNHKSPGQKRHHDQVSKAYGVMLGNLEFPHTLETLADVAGMSRSNFHQHFSRAYGVPPIALLKSLRLSNAKDLLRDTNLPIKVISAGVGYKSRSYFTQAFKAAFGVDPTSFRCSSMAKP